MIARFACLLLLLLAAAPAQTWIQSPVNGNWYALTPPGTWDSTEQWAVGQNAHLATIRSAAEQQWVYQTFRAGSATNCWLGLNDLAAMGTWTWTSGEPVTFTNWGGGEPNFPGVERWVELTPNNGGSWNNQSNFTRPGIAERRGAAFTAGGPGCSAGSSAPSLTASATPRFGTTFALQVNGVVPGSVGFLVIANNLDPWNNQALPLDLAPLGFPTGCFLRVNASNAVTATLVASAAGVAQFSIALPPPAPQFLRDLHLQYASIDLGAATPMPIVWSNSATARLGF